MEPHQSPPQGSRAPCKKMLIVNLGAGRRPRTQPTVIINRVREAYCIAARVSFHGGADTTRDRRRNASESERQLMAGWCPRRPLMHHSAVNLIMHIMSASEGSYSQREDNGLV